MSMPPPQSVRVLIVDDHGIALAIYVYQHGLAKPPA